VLRRKKRDTSSVDFESDEYLLPADIIADLEEFEIPGPEGLHPNATWPTPSGVTLDNATSLCEEPIWTLPIFATCDEFTRTSRQAVIDSCILDILVGRAVLTTRYLTLHTKMTVCNCPLSSSIVSKFG